MLTACATPPSEPAANLPEPLSVEQQLQADQLLDQAIQLDRMGEFEAALPLYQQLLDVRPGAMVAERASRIAAESSQWEIALASSLVWIQVDPTSSPAKQLNTVALLRLGQTDAAIQALASEIDKADDVRANWQLALGLLSVAPDSNLPADQGQAQVMSLLDQLLLETGHAPDSAFAFFQRSRLAWQQGNSDLALEYAQAASTTEANYINSMWAAGLAVQQQQLELAQRLYQQARALEQDPLSQRSIQAALAESEVLGRLGRSEQSLVLLQSLPDTSETFYARALLELDLNNTDAALENWQQLAEQALQTTEPDFNRAAWLAAILAEVLELDKQAIDWYARVEGQQRANARMRQASLLAKSGQLDQSRALLAQLRDGSDPGLTEQSYLVESELLIGQGQVETALELLIEAVAKQPSSLSLLYGRAMAAVQANRIELAEQDLRAIIQRESQNAIALNALGYTLSDRTDRQEEALRLIERALALEPENPAILDSMGWVLFKLGQPEQALPYLERAAEGDFHPEIVAHLIEVLWTLDREPEARSLLQRAEPEFFDDPVFSGMLIRTGLAD